MQVNVNHRGGTVDVVDVGADAVVTVSWTVSGGLDFRSPMAQTFALDGLESITVGAVVVARPAQVESEPFPVPVTVPVVEEPVRDPLAKGLLEERDPEAAGIDVGRVFAAVESAVVTFGGVPIIDQDEDED